MKIVITGAGGMLGWHLRCHLAALQRYQDCVIALDRQAFNDDSILSAALKGATTIVHCAGINRACDDDLEKGNEEIARRLVGSLSKGAVRPHLIYTNTIHWAANNAYGRGKARAHEVFDRWSRNNDTPYTNLVLPHAFGECGRPFYNSVVFTFCQQIVMGESLKVQAGGRLELLHAQDISARIVDALERVETGEVRLKGRAISVADLAGRLVAMHDSYTNDIIPDLRERFDLQLFNTLRSFLYPKYYPKSIKVNTDDRGSLFEAVKNRNGGQAFLSTTKPGVTRGNHYHFNKVERFLVIRGQAVIRIRRLFDDVVQEFHVSGHEPVYVDMPPLHTHSISNTGDDELVTLFWSHEIFDPERPDTFFQPVLLEKES
jgi:UDP-2-acetamido-2,6-beta-L-arabino-hexul-4-ose reductase